MKKEQIQQTRIHRNMNKISLFIVSSAVGYFVCFAIAYWLFHSSLKESLIVSLAVPFGGLVAEYINGIGKRNADRDKAS